MNRVYRLVWCRAAQSLVPVAEIVKGTRCGVRGFVRRARKAGGLTPPVCVRKPSLLSLAMAAVLWSTASVAYAVTPISVTGGTSQTFYGNGVVSNGDALANSGSVNLATTETQFFGYSGSVQSAPVPDGASSLTATVNGAGGAAGFNIESNGGAGDSITGVIPLTSVTSGMQIVVGGGGQNTVPTDGQAGGGGGLTGVFSGTPAQSTAIIVAGGGGGGGSPSASGTTAPGGNAGLNPPAPTVSYGTPGAGFAAGGSAVTGASGTDGTAFGSGGAGGLTTNGGGFGGGGGGGDGESGGGGGGGFVGGAGGGTNASSNGGVGGGGGRSYVSTAVGSSYTESVAGGGAGGTSTTNPNGTSGSVSLLYLFPHEYTIDTLSGSGTLYTGTGTNSVTLNLANAGDNGSGSGTFTGVMSGGGGLIISGGTEDLGAADTYTGATSVGYGATLILTGAGSIASSPGVTVNGTFDVSGATTAPVSITSLAGIGTVKLGSQSLVLTQAAGTFGGTIADGGAAGGTSGSLVIANGTETLSGLNTYTGSTTVGSGATLAVTNLGALSDSSGVIDLGTLDLSGLSGGAATIESLTGSGTVTLGTNQGTELALTHASGTFAGTISGAGVFGVTQGTETLSGVNSYTGETAIGANGNLILANANAIADSYGVSDQGILNIATLPAGSVANIKNLSDSATTGVVNLGTNTLNITEGAGNFDGVITGSGSLEISGNPSGQVEYLSGDNNYTGNTVIAAGAELGISGGGSIATSAVLDSGTLTIAPASGTVSLASLGGGGGVQLGANTLFLTQAANTFSGVITGTGGLHVGGGSETLSGANSYTGSTTIDSGASLLFTGVGAVFSSPDMIDNGTLNIAGSVSSSGTGPTMDQIDSLNGGGTVVLGNNSLTILHANNAVFTGSINGAGSLYMGGGSETLGGANGYTGTTYINQGADLALSGNGTLASTSLQDLGTLDVSGAAGTVNVNNLWGGSTGLVNLGSRSLSLQSGATTIGNAADTFSGTIKGSGAVTLVNGTETLSGVGRYFGNTYIDAGARLALSGAGSIQDSSSVNNNGTFDVSSLNVGTAATIQDLSGTNGAALVNLGAHNLNLAAATGVYAGTISGSGGLVVSGGQETLTGTNTYSGATTVGSGAELLFTGNGSIASSNGLAVQGTLDVSGITPTNFSTFSSVTGNGEISLGTKNLVLTGYTSNPSTDWSFQGLLNGTGSAGYYTAGNTFVTIAKGQGSSAPTPLTSSVTQGPATGQTTVTLNGATQNELFVNNNNTLTLNHALVENFDTKGGAGSGGGAGLGGAVFVGSGSNVIVNSSTFQNNTAQGGVGGVGTVGGSLNNLQPSGSAGSRGISGTSFGGQPFQSFVHLTGGSGTNGATPTAGIGGAGGSGGAGASYGPITGINSFGETLTLQEEQVAEALATQRFDIASLTLDIAQQLKDASDLALDTAAIGSNTANAAATETQAAAITTEGVDLTTLGGVDAAVAITDGVSAAVDSADAADPFEAPLAATDAGENVAKAVEDGVAAGEILASDSTILATDAASTAAAGTDAGVSASDAIKIAADIYQQGVDVAAEGVDAGVLANDSAAVSTNIQGLNYLVTNSNNGLEGYLAAAAAGTIGQGSRGGSGGLGAGGTFGFGGGAGGAGGAGGGGASVNETINLADVLASLGITNDPFPTGGTGLSGFITYSGGAAGGNGGDGAAGGAGGFGAGGGSGGNGGSGGVSGNAGAPAWVGQVGIGGSGGQGGFGAGVGSIGSGLNGNGGFGGGGSGFGGAIFVNTGGGLTVTGTSLFKGNNVIGGGSLNGGASGQAAGTAIFAMKGANVVFDPGAGHVITFDDGIADNSAASISGSGIAAGNGAAINIGNSGAPGTDTGLVVFNGTNTYSGATNIYSGVLQAVDGVGIDQYSNINIAGGVLQTTGTFSRFVGVNPNDIQWTAGGGFSAFGGGLTVSLDNGNPLIWGGNAFEVAENPLVFGSSSANGNTTFTNAIDLNGVTQTILVNPNGSNTDAAIMSGVLSDGGLTVGSTTSTGQLQLTAVNSYAGQTTINAGGDLQLLSNGSIAQSDEILDNGTFDIAGAAAPVNITTLAGSGAMNLGNTGLILTAAGSHGTGSGDFSGVISGNGGITVANGTEALSGINTYNGPTSIDAPATLQLIGSGSISNTLVVQDNGTFDISGASASETVGSLSGTGAVILGTNSLALTNGLGDGLPNTYGVFNGAVSGSGGLTLMGGSETLGGGNTYTGATAIATGAELLLAGSGSIADSSGLSNNGTFDISQATGPVRLTTLFGSGNVLLGANNLTLTGANGIESGVIANGGVMNGIGGSLTVAAGDENLTRINTYTGETTIENGAGLTLTGAGSIAASSELMDNGVFNIAPANGPTVSVTTLGGSGSVTLGSNSLDLTDASTTFSGSIAGLGGLSLGAGSETLSGINTYTGATAIATASDLLLTGDGSVANSSGIYDSGNFDIQGATAPVYVVSLSGSGNVALGGNDLVLTAPQSTYSGAISGTGGVVLDAGAEVLSGASSYSGGTELNVGTTASIAAADNLGTGPIVLNGGTLLTTQSLVDTAPIEVSAQNGTLDNGSSHVVFTGSISPFLTPYTAPYGTLFLTGSGSTALSGTITDVTVDNRIQTIVTGGGTGAGTGGTSGTGGSGGTTSTGGSGLQLQSGSITNVSTFNNSGTIVMNSGSQINASGSVNNSGTITMDPTALISVGGAFANSGTLNTGFAVTGSGNVATELPASTTTVLPVYDFYGAVAPTSQTTVQGNYTSTATSNLSFGLTPTGYTQMAASGNVVLNGDLVVQVAPGNLPNVRNTYSLISDTNAGARLSGQFSQVTVLGLPQGYVYRLLYVTDPMMAMVTYNPNQFAQVAQTDNEKAVGNTLDTALPTASGSLYTMLNALYSEPASGQAASLSQMDGENYAEAGAVLRTASSNTWRPVYGRMGLTGTPRHHDGAHDPHVWMATTGGIDSFQNTGNASGVSSSNAGLTLGGDINRGPFTVGMAGGYGLARDTRNSPGVGTLAAHLWDLGVYGDWRHGTQRLGGMLGYTGGQLAENNAVTLGSGSYQTSGSTPISLYTAGVREAVGFRFHQVHVTRILGLTYVHTRIDGLTETGGGPLSLNVQSQSRNSLRARFLMRASRSFSWQGVHWRPSISGGVRQELLNPSTGVQESFTGIPGAGFTVDGVRANRTLGIAGVALRARVTQNLSAQLSYQGEFGASTTLNIFSGNVSYRW